VTPDNNQNLAEPATPWRGFALLLPPANLQGCSSSLVDGRLLEDCALTQSRTVILQNQENALRVALFRLASQLSLFYFRLYKTNALLKTTNDAYIRVAIDSLLKVF
jgi:hypothetical protein